jgi:hypothetical protein
MDHKEVTSLGKLRSNDCRIVVTLYSSRRTTVAHEPASHTNMALSRRTAIQAGVAASAAVTISALDASRGIAQDGTPPTMGGATEHLEVDVVVSNPVTITLAGGGPPQRGDFFYIDGPIYAAGDAGGAQIGQYNCFGAWTIAAATTDATYQRLTTVQFRFDDGSIMGLINEGGTGPNIGAVQGGTERYDSVLGTFTQTVVQGTTPGVPTPAAGGEASPAASAATPAAAGTLVHAVFDLTRSSQS